MEETVGILGATTVATMLVSIFKFAAPSASSKLIAFVAFISGQLSAIAVQGAGAGLSLSQKVIFSVIITGVLATAAAMGIRKADQAAEDKRTGPEVQAQREATAELGAIQEKQTQTPQ